MIRSLEETLNGSMKKAPPGAWNWQNRARAWIFGMEGEHLLGTSDAHIIDGGPYTVWALWPAGVSMPKGEAARATRIKNECHEFHMTMEQSFEDLAKGLIAKGNYAVTPKHCFWIDPTGTGEDSWRVLYAMAPGVRLVDIVALRNRMDHPGRARMMVAIESSRMKLLRDDIEKR